MLIRVISTLRLLHVEFRQNLLQYEALLIISKRTEDQIAWHSNLFMNGEGVQVWGWSWMKRYSEFYEYLNSLSN
jgi:hypothetical protein